MIRRWLALTYYLYALRLAALSHFILINYIINEKSSLHFSFPKCRLLFYVQQLSEPAFHHGHAGL